ncbi:MAG: HslU--HslV peptidase proteolytic subunit [Robiginitomaculum sp.]|nr:MAG: HslU--HslV peptidase proteolytic subunit [Robiginitomaculum sp.]
MPDNYDYADASQWRGTTILTVRKNGKVVVIGDGQVSAGNTVMKATARKVRRIVGGSVIIGFAGATADAFALMERLESKLEQFPTQLARACVELAKDWRTDKYLRQLQAMMIVADKKETYVLTGNGDVVEPDVGRDGGAITAIGSGGNYALAAARALDSYEDDAETLARKAMQIAADICVFTNENFIIETLEEDA